MEDRTPHPIPKGEPRFRDNSLPSAVTVSESRAICYTAKSTHFIELAFCTVMSFSLENISVSVAVTVADSAAYTTASDILILLGDAWLGSVCTVPTVI